MVPIDSVQHSVDGFRPPVGHSCSVPPEQQIPGRIGARQPIPMGTRSGDATPTGGTMGLVDGGHCGEGNWCQSPNLRRAWAWSQRNLRGSPHEPVAHPETIKMGGGIASVVGRLRQGIGLRPKGAGHGDPALQ